MTRRQSCGMLMTTFLVLFAGGLEAAVPLQVNQQGRVAVSGIVFDGNGAFRFALVDPDTGNNAWTNDGTRAGSTQMPDSAVSLPVINGIYNVRLGDTTLPNMTALSSAVFNEDNLKLRVWFDDGTHGVQQLTPDQPLASAPYAMHAAAADTATSAAYAATATAASNADTVDNRHAADLVSADSLPFNLLENGSFERWLLGTTADPDKWTNHGNVTVRRETITAKADAACARMESTADTYLYQVATTDTTSIRNAPYTFSCWVYCGSPNAARIAIDDGVSVSYSPFHSGTPGWERLSVTVTASAAATKIEARLALAWATTAYVDGAVLVMGSTPMSYAPRVLDETALTWDRARASVFVGEVRMWGGMLSRVPEGWVACDGTTVSRTVYRELFDAIGTIYGEGDGATTFNLPDFRNRFLVGASGGIASIPMTDVSGSHLQTGGEASHQLTVQEMPSHNHTLLQYVDRGISPNNGGQMFPMTSYSGQTDNAGGNQPHNNLPPYFAITFIIKY